MIKVALTGNFRSGHREIAKTFAKNGVPIFDVDLTIKYLINRKKEIKKLIQDEYGKHIYSGGLLSIEKFNNNEKFEKLLDLIAPEIFSTYSRFLKINSKYAYTIFLSSILFEMRWDKRFDYNMNVFKAQFLRRKDLIKNTKMSEDMIDFILTNEMDEYYKNTKSDHIIQNYFHQDDKRMKKQIIQIHSNIIRNCDNLDYVKVF